MLCDNVLQTNFNVLWVENSAKLIIFAVAVSSFFLDNSDRLIVLQRYARHRGCPILGQKKSQRHQVAEILVFAVSRNRDT